MFQDKIDQFKEEKIISEIIKTELEENVMMTWLGKLHFHSFSTENHYWYKQKNIGKLLGTPKDIEGENSDCDQNMDSDEQPETDVATNLTGVSIDNTVVDEKMAKPEPEIDSSNTVNEQVTTDNQPLKVHAESDSIDSERKVGTEGGTESDTVKKDDDDVAEEDRKRNVESS